jgi:hypothetical protein
MAPLIRLVKPIADSSPSIVWPGLAQAYTDYYGAVADFNRAQFRLYRALAYPAQVLLDDPSCDPGNGHSCRLVEAGLRTKTVAGQQEDAEEDAGHTQGHDERQGRGDAQR